MHTTAAVFGPFLSCNTPGRQLCKGCDQAGQQTPTTNVFFSGLRLAISLRPLKPESSSLYSAGGAQGFIAPGQSHTVRLGIRVEGGRAFCASRRPPAVPAGAGALR